MPTTILITGASARSFVGASLVQAFSGDAALTILAPTRAQLPLTDAAAVRAYIEVNAPAAVVHCAVAGEGSGGEAEADLRMFFALAGALQSGLYQKLVYIGSGAEYDKSLPIDGLSEDAFGRAVPEPAYGFSKYVMNHFTRQAAAARKAQELAPDIINLRLFSGYGPRENWRTRFISGLCCKAILGLPLTIRQDCLFDFVYIDDIVAAVRWALTKTPGWPDYNLSSGAGASLLQVAEMVKAQSGTNSPIVIQNAGRALPYVGNNTRLAAESGIRFTKLEGGIAAMLRYYEANIDEIDPAALSV